MIQFEQDVFYDIDSVRSILAISSHALNNACNSGALRFSDAAGRRMFRGAWLIAWLEGCEQSEPTPHELLTTKEAAAMLSISERKLWSLSNRGEIPRVRAGRAVRYLARDLYEFIDQQRKPVAV